MTVHYDDGYGWPACGVKSQKSLTCVPRKVTCVKCKRTKTYRYMME